MNDWTFDANDVKPFATRFLAELHEQRPEAVDQAYNAMVFLDDDGNVLDWEVTDIAGEWAGDGPDPDDVWQVIFEELAPEGTTNLIVIHGHEPDIMRGPCNGLAEFGALCMDAAKAFDCTARAIVVLRGDELDGTMYLQERPEGRSTIDPVMASLARMLRGEWLRRKASGQDVHEAILDGLNEVIAAAEEGRVIDPEIMRSAIKATQLDLAKAGVPEMSDEDFEGLLGELEADEDLDLTELLGSPSQAAAAQPLDPGKLPPLPDFDPFDPTTWRN